MRNLTIILGIVTLFLCQPANAGYQYPFAQITCVPEYRFFDVRYKAIPNGVLEFEKDDDLKSRDPWAPKGFYGTEILEYECRFPDAGVSYRMKVSGGLAECGFFKERLLTISRNEKTWIDQVHFGHSCNDEVIIQDINIIEARQGWNGGSIEICFRIQKKNVTRCWRDSSPGLYNKLPVNKPWVDKYVTPEGKDVRDLPPYIGVPDPKKDQDAAELFKRRNWDELKVGK